MNTRLKKSRRAGPSDDNGGGRKDMNARFGSRPRGKGDKDKVSSRDNSNLRLKEAGSSLMISGPSKKNPRGKRDLLAESYLGKK